LILPYLLTAFTAYQFLFRTVRLEGSPIYLIANPYYLLLPLIFIWLGAVILVGKRSDRNFFIGWLLLLIFPSLMLRSFNGQAGFVYLYFRGLQFFWGPLLIMPGLLGLFRLLGFVEEGPGTIRRYLTLIALIAGSLTIFEVLAVDILHVPPLTFPWIGNPGDPNPPDLHPFRPWGLPSYPQPNALILAYLFWLTLLYRTNGISDKIATCAGVILSGSGTGQVGLAILAPLGIRKPWLLLAIVLVPSITIVTWATLTHQYATSPTVIGKFDLAYAFRLSGSFITIAQRFFGQFTASELLFGSVTPTSNSVIGLTHDWAYLDVFFSYGIVGVFGYIALFGTMLFLSLPFELSTEKKFYFAIVGLALNFHYGTLNFYVGQFLFSCLAALQLNRFYSRSVANNSTPQTESMQPMT
jgi:hypothetical protein